MKKSLIAAGVLALMASTGAKAADIVTYQNQPVAATPAAPAAVNWNGVYIGGTIGGSWADSTAKLKYGKEKVASKGVDPNSFIGGFYAGYNFQPNFLANSFLKDIVFGIETDFLWNSGDGNGSKALSAQSYSYKASVRQKWNGATRIRAGYAMGPEGRFLPYIAGGVSYADIQAKGRVNDAAVNIYSRNSTKSTAGWNIGAGVDYVPPILNDHLVLRAEYRYTDFGTVSFGKGNIGYAAGYPLASLKQKADYSQNDFRVGVAYKF